MGRVKYIFKWSASEGMIPPSVPQSLAMVTGLRKGHTEARETAPILPVDDAAVDVTLTFSGYHRSQQDRRGSDYGVPCRARTGVDNTMCR